MRTHISQHEDTDISYARAMYVVLDDKERCALGVQLEDIYI